MISEGLWLHFVVAVFLKNRQVSKGALHIPRTRKFYLVSELSSGGVLPRIEVEIKARGALGYFLGGYVPPGTPNWHPFLKKISPKTDTPF